MERTLALIKPDGVRRGLVGEVIGRLEKSGLSIVALKMMRLDAGQAEAHYRVHRGKPFYPMLLEHITSGPVVAAVCEGPAAVERLRELVGATDPALARPGTIRGDLGLDITQNVIHASDSPETAVSEIRLFFPEIGGARLVEAGAEP
ncbi:MAG: nucleoside-diphosphate kinase [Firmicutes bacterium]|nr:nucleoside-diphosphate kinase [Bacillota bacterium]